MSFNFFSVIFKTSALIMLLSSTCVNAQMYPTQAQIVKEGTLKYFYSLPKNGWEALLHLMKMGSFDLMLNQHKTVPEKSPFRMFNSTFHRRKPNLAWSLSIKNDEKYFRGIMKLQYGVCAGLTIVTRKLQMLAFFDPQNKFKQIVPNLKGSNEWFNFMKHKIDDVIANNKMTIIPYFHNTLELSNEPRIKRYLKEHIIRQWELANINVLQGVYQGYLGSIRMMDHRTALENIKQLKETLKLGINPIMIMPAPDSKLFSTDKWIHVVQVVDIIKNVNAYTLKIWDPNVDDPNKSADVNIFDNGQMFFEDRALAGIYPIRWDNLEIADMVEKNLQFCIDRPGFCTTFSPWLNSKNKNSSPIAPKHITIPTALTE